MLADKKNNLTSRERLEFLLNDEKSTGNNSGTNSQHRAFLAGVGLTLLLAGTVFVTHHVDMNSISPTSAGGQPVDSRLKVQSAVVTRTESASTEAVSALATTGRRSTALASFLPSLPSPGETHNPGPNPVTAVIPEVSHPPQNNKGAMAQIPGLRASRSVITGVLDPATLSASYYWTFTLNNSSSADQEAQMTIELPDGAVISRATLWIDGKAEEAAFNTTAQVQNAYDWIVTRHRDPLLVTQTENGDISLKAAPVVPGKEMKLRIGVTVPMRVNAEGACRIDLPQVLQSNLDLGCPQNIHLTSKSPVYANNANMSASRLKTGYLLRGNVNSSEMKQLAVIMKRDPKVTRFATRATHSFPQGYIVATVAHDGQGETLQLTKSIDKPDCPYIDDNDAAFRLSYLWVKAEIERLHSSNFQQAVQLASVYRVVSPVSGAVVLERKTDYEFNGLDRNMYRSLAYAPGVVTEAERRLQSYDDRIAMAQPAPSAAPKAQHSRRRAEHNSADAEAKSDASAKNEFSSQSVASRAKQQEKEKSSVARMANEDKAYRNLFSDAGSSQIPIASAGSRKANFNETMSNLAGAWGMMHATSSSRDANVFENTDQEPSRLPYWMLLLPAIALNFAGGLILLIAAIRSAIISRPGALTLALSGISWIALSWFASDKSQILTLIAIPVVLWNLLRRGKRSSGPR
ncbi:MAG: hypothetical protein K2X93_03605 [Candidatus Obscuribacterales bacterium]|nr:hypothetical protein [Candidatus Obscuribacterales bacterium]